MMRTMPLDDEGVRRASDRIGALPLTSAVPVVSWEDTEDAWLAARRLGVSASELAAVDNASPYTSAFALWWSKQPDWPLPPPAMRHRVGHAMEPLAAQIWGEEHPEAAVYRSSHRMWASHEHPEITATPDYLVVFDDNPSIVEPLECKSDDGGKGWTKDDVPFHHRLQVWQQCYVFGSPRGHIQRVTKKRATSYVIPFGEEEREKYEAIKRHALAFVASLNAGTPPPIDESHSTEETLIALNPSMDEGARVRVSPNLARDFGATCRMIRMLKKREAKLRNEMRQSMGRAQYAIDDDGEIIAERRIYKRPEYTVQSGTVDGIWRKEPHGAELEEVPTD